MRRALRKSKVSDGPAKLVRQVADASKALLGDVSVKVFGGVALGDITGASDIDILIVSSRIPRAAVARAQLKEALEKAAGLPPINAVEMHLVTPAEAESNPFYREILKKGTA